MGQLGGGSVGQSRRDGDKLGDIGCPIKKKARAIVK